MGEVVQMDEWGAVDVGDAYDTDEPSFYIAVDHEQPGQDLQLIALNDLVNRTERTPPKLTLIEGGYGTDDRNCN